MMSSHRALSDTALSELTYKLRYANAHYAQIAFEMRCRIMFTRTHHAKRRAFWFGLRIDIKKAKRCSMTAISVRPLPVLDMTPSPSPIMLSLQGPVVKAHNRVSPESELPHIIIPSPKGYAHPSERLMIRIPPLASLYDDMYCHEQYRMAAPHAPLMRAKELPEECNMRDPSTCTSSPATSLSPLTPMDMVRSVLRIKIPARKRKLEDADNEEDYCPNSSNTKFPKRLMRRRWARSQTTITRLGWSRRRLQLPLR